MASRCVRNICFIIVLGQPWRPVQCSLLIPDTSLVESEPLAPDLLETLPALPALPGTTALDCVIASDCLYEYRFTYDADYTLCSGLQYVTYLPAQGLLLGIVLCSATRYHLYMSDNALTFHNIGDLNGAGEDQCAFVPGGYPSKAVVSADARFSPGLVGFFRGEIDDYIKKGDIGSQVGRPFASWLECAVSIPGTLAVVQYAADPINASILSMSVALSERPLETNPTMAATAVPAATPLVTTVPEVDSSSTLKTTAEEASETTGIATVAMETSTEVMIDSLTSGLTSVKVSSQTVEIMTTPIETTVEATTESRTSIATAPTWPLAPENHQPTETFTAEEPTITEHHFRERLDFVGPIPLGGAEFNMAARSAPECATICVRLSCLSFHHTGNTCLVTTAGDHPALQYLKD